MSFIILDIETNGLYNPDKVWLAALKDLETQKVTICREPHRDTNSRQLLKRLLKGAAGVIGHNLIGFDLKVLSQVLGIQVPKEKVIDTLVVSRLLNYSVEGGYSLEAIGSRLGYPKGSHSDWTQWSQEMEDYCVRDVEVTEKYYEVIKPFLFSPQWRNSLRLEHDIAFLCQEMSDNGFHFNIKEAKELHQKILLKLESLDKELCTAFPPRSKLIKEITPRVTANGTLHRGDFRWVEGGDLTPFSPGATFSRIQFEPFNPGSPKQIVERLNEAGWTPTEKTKGHLQAERSGDTTKLETFKTFGWTISEKNLSTLPDTAPEAAKKLVQRLLLDSRRSTLVEWIEAYNPTTGRIHPRFHHIGAWTQRMSHSNPNGANIPATPQEPEGREPTPVEKISLEINPLMRSFWNVPEDHWLVGVDADGIQLRILAHYMDDPVFTEGLINGKKEDGTDAHSLNKRALGRVCISRDAAKTFIYAWLLGAGSAKIAEIFNCSKREAKQASSRFIEAYPGLRKLKEEIIPRDASRGYFEGLDGRYILCDSEHLMLAGYLQAGEAIVMKTALRLWTNQLKEEGIHDWLLVNFVHDEWQTEITKDDYNLAKYIAQVQAESITKAGKLLGVKCPLAGSFLNSHGELSIGKNWSNTH